jgi:hypothetical protein
VIDRLISIVDPQGEAYGAIALQGERAAGGYLRGPDSSLAIDDGSATRGEGAVRIETGGEDLVLGLAAQTSPLAFETGEGRSVTVQAVGASCQHGPSGFEARGVAWAIEGEHDQGSLRTLWALLADGTLLLLFALRPTEAGDHGSETIGAARITRDGGVTSYAEPLISTEYDASGSHTRATLELWQADSEEGAFAERAGGTRVSGGAGRIAGQALEAARFDWRVGGTPGVGAYEILSP